MHMIKGLRVKLFKTRAAEVAFEAYNAGWNNPPWYSEDAPSWCDEHWEVWRREWRRGRADNVEECARYYQEMKDKEEI